MTRAELVAEVRRLADETAGLAAEVRRGDVAVQLLGQVRDFGHRLPPGLAADIRRVVDDMVATRHEAHGEPSCSPRSGTSSAGGSGQRPPAAPSTETRQAAQDGQSGSGGDATDGVPAHQPTPQVGDKWACAGHDQMVRVVEVRDNPRFPHLTQDVGGEDGLLGGLRSGNLEPSLGWRLVERDGRPWPPAREPEPVAVEPATDEQIASLERMLSDPDARPRDGSGISWHSARALLARFRQEQARAENAERDGGPHR